jgi:hypothetical protein
MMEGHMITRRLFLAITAGAVMLPRELWAAAEVPAMLDHILLGCSDLDQGIAFVESHTGVRPAVGGVHPGRGTRNALLSLGKLHYLEVIAPDPQQHIAAAGPSLLKRIQQLAQPTLVDWAVHTNDLKALAARLRKQAIPFEGPNPGSRKRPDGRVLNWQTLTFEDDHHGMVPFYIQWGAGSVHPSSDAPGGCKLAAFSAAGPNPDQLRDIYRRRGIDVHVERASSEQLRASIVGPKGTLKLG